MAEKEERTLHIIQKIEGRFAGETHITRTEAIIRMAKAMCHSPFESCEGCIVQKKKQACKQALEGMKDLAEVALNALLEADK